MFAARPPERSRVSSRRCAVGIGNEKCLAWHVSWSFRVAGVENFGHVGVSPDPGLAFRVAGVGNRGVCAWEEHGGCALRVAGAGLRMHVAAWEGAGRGGGSAWRVWGIVDFDVAQRAVRVAGVRNAANVDSRDRRGESCT